MTQEALVYSSERRSKFVFFPIGADEDPRRQVVFHSPDGIRFFRLQVVTRTDLHWSGGNAAEFIIYNPHLLGFPGCHADVAYDIHCPRSAEIPTFQRMKVERLVSGELMFAGIIYRLDVSSGLLDRLELTEETYVAVLPVPAS